VGDHGAAALSVLNEAARTRFMAEPDEAIFLADNKWPAIMKTLVR